MQLTPWWQLIENALLTGFLSNGFDNEQTLRSALCPKGVFKNQPYPPFGLGAIAKKNAPFNAISTLIG